MIGIPVHLRWDGVCIPTDQLTQQTATGLWRNSAALGRCAVARAPKPPPQYSFITHDSKPGVGTTLKTSPVGVTVDATSGRFAPAQEWAWIKASIRNIQAVGGLVLQIRDNQGTLVYAERLTQQQVWGLPRDQPDRDGVPAPPLRHVPDEPPEKERIRAGLSWANPTRSPYEVTILVTKRSMTEPNTIGGTPDLTENGPGNDHVTSTPLRGLSNELKVEVHSMRMELVPWRELYEATTNRSADEVPPTAGPDQIRWVQYKLNELGWYAGKLGDDANDPDLMRAIIRYRQSHKELSVRLFQDSNEGGIFPFDGNKELSSAIDDELIAKLESNEQARTLTDTPNAFDVGVDGKIYLDAERFCQDPSSEMKSDEAGAASTRKHELEERWLSTPRFPLRAKVSVKDELGNPVRVPGVDRSLDVQWRWQDRDEPGANLAAGFNTTKEYVERVLPALRNSFPAGFNNARDVVGGQISQDDAENQAVVFDEADGKLTKGPQGATTRGEVVFFSPSKIAGDNYQITATVGNRSAQTGWMTLWRRIQVTGHVVWGDESTDDWTTVAAKYAPAYVEIVKPPPENIKTMTELLTPGSELSMRIRKRFGARGIRVPANGLAWDPRDFSAGVSPEEMVAALEAILNEGENNENGGKYDAWKNGEDIDTDISKLYVKALALINNDWKKGNGCGANGDVFLIAGHQHYLTELQRITEEVPMEPTLMEPAASKPKIHANLPSFLQGALNKKVKPPMIRRFRRALLENRGIAPWDGSKEAVKRVIDEDSYELIDQSRTAVQFQLDKILGPGIVVLEFEPHRIFDGHSSQRSENIMMGGGKVVINRACFASYRSDHLFTHEIAHALFLKHYKNAPDHVVADHDQSDDNCVMSYIARAPENNTFIGNADHYGPGQYDPEFCGKCNLKLRGWNIRAKRSGTDVLPAKARDEDPDLVTFIKNQK